MNTIYNHQEIAFYLACITEYIEEQRRALERIEAICQKHNI